MQRLGVHLTGVTRLLLLLTGVTRLLLLLLLLLTQRMRVMSTAGRSVNRVCAHQPHMLPAEA
jgi:hypothetical protein